MKIVTIDPGAFSGVALFSDGKLVQTRKLRVKTDCTMDFTKRISADLVICERPQVYTTAKAKGDPNSVLKIAERAAFLVASLIAPKTQVLWVLPRAWKGNLPKEVCHKRLEKILSEEELKIFSKATMDEKDAVGIGLWYLKRFNRK